LKCSSQLDHEVGMQVYASGSPPCKALVKSSDDDFRVEEVVSLALLSSEARPGLYPVYRVEKRSIDTMHMEGALSAALGSKVSYGGLKDKKAVALQYVTPTSAKSERPETVIRPGFDAKLVGYLPTPITRGSVLGNRFTIVLRECCPNIGESVSGAFDLARKRMVPNFFGYQRFGISGIGTHKIGKAMVKRRFDDAVGLMLLTPRENDDEGTTAAREAMAKGDFRTGARLLSPGQDLERKVALRLAQDPGDSIRAIRGVPVRMRRLYVQAYQSYIFNRTISLAVASALDISAAGTGDNWGELGAGVAVDPKVRGARETPTDGALPMAQLAGYAYRDYGSRFDALASRVMGEEEVSPRDFYIKEMQEASAEGGFRPAHLLVADPVFEATDNDASLSFTLSRGQYATVLLREIIKPADPRESGLA
jgi:tRNA pseudouridine13 synthase